LVPEATLLEKIIFPLAMNVSTSPNQIFAEGAKLAHRETAVAEVNAAKKCNVTHDQGITVRAIELQRCSNRIRQARANADKRMTVLTLAPKRDVTRKPGLDWRRGLLIGSAACAIFLLTAWAALAIYFGGAGGGRGRALLAIAFVAMTAFAWCLKSARIKQFRILWAAAVVVITVWFIAIQPSHQRHWKGEVAVLPRIEVAGDRAKITGVRDFEYRSRDDFDVRYIERKIDLSHLTGVDLFISYWDDELMAHTFLSFVFDSAPPICVSIEARPENGERFAALPSLFKRFELIYVVGEERDIVRVRTNHRDEQVYRYPIKISPEAARRLFMVYAQKINQLAERPEFYHLLQNSCTANIVRNARAAGQKTPVFEGRFILNGLVDEYLYEAGLVDTNIPFQNLRKRARITDISKSASLHDFSRAIRSPAPSN
jgi:hypothetical protein